jgi:hypothetical protein
VWEGYGGVFGKGMESRYEDDPIAGWPVVPSAIQGDGRGCHHPGKEGRTRAPRRRSTEPRAHASTIRPPGPASVHLEGVAPRSLGSGSGQCSGANAASISFRVAGWLPGSDSIVAGFLGDAGGSGGWRRTHHEAANVIFYFRSL